MKRISRQDLDAMMERTEPFWRDLSGGRIFMTGGTGFFGAWLMEAFIAAQDRLGLGFDAILLTRSPERVPPWFNELRGIQFVRGDVSSFPFPPGGFTHVIHGATTRAHETFNEPPLSKFQTVAMGTRRVLDFCVEKNVDAMLYLGSGAACGKQAAGVVRHPEDSTSAPDTMSPAAALGHGKRVAEFFCSAYAQEFGLKVKMTRCFSFLGPHLPLDIHYAIGNFIRDGLLGQAIRVKGDGRPVRSYLYMSDLVVWLMTIFFCGEPSRIYHVGSEDGRSIRELAEVVGSCFDPAMPVEMPTAPVSPPATAASDIYVPCTLRARSELGLEETVSLEKGIQKTIDFCR